MQRSRVDISGVEPQDGYVARRCPVRAQYDELRPAEPPPRSPAALRRVADDVAFEAEVFERLVELLPATAVIHPGGPDDRADRERRTLAAMNGASLILGGRLPVDEAARRVGEPDVLLACARRRLLPHRSSTTAR